MLCLFGPFFLGLLFISAGISLLLYSHIIIFWPIHCDFSKKHSRSINNLLFVARAVCDQETESLVLLLNVLQFVLEQSVSWEQPGGFCASPMQTLISCVYIWKKNPLTMITNQRIGECQSVVIILHQ